jgi:hypothetical protein
MKTLLFSVLFCFSSFAFSETRTMTLEHMTTGQSYFKVNVTDNGLLKGTFPGWCADWNTRIEDNTVYNTRFYSSLNQNIPGDVVDHPEYLDEVNWLINQNFVGKPSRSGLGVYTIGDVQLAIWTMVDDEFDSSTVGSFSQARVNELVARAKVEGADFSPNCRQLVGIILIPSHPQSGNPSQNTIILVPKYRFPKCVVPDSDEK